MQEKRNAFTEDLEELLSNIIEADDEFEDEEEFEEENEFEEEVDAEEVFEELLKEAIYEYFDDSAKSVQTFNEAGVMTNNKGLVIQLDEFEDLQGNIISGPFQFQITIVEG